VLAFNGDVYEGLDAEDAGRGRPGLAAGHLCILSGLYGVLRPLDLMQPYRLEMGTRLATAKGRNLYQFWGSQIADYLNRRAQADPSPVVVNLASEEYFKAVDRKALQPRVVSCVFEEQKGGKYKVISFMAKRARGLMVRYAVQQRAETVEQLKGFDLEGYRLRPPPASRPAGVPPRARSLIPEERHAMTRRSPPNCASGSASAAARGFARGRAGQAMTDAGWQETWPRRRWQTVQASLGLQPEPGAGPPVKPAPPSSGPSPDGARRPRAACPSPTCAVRRGRSTRATAWWT
jgi:hypothetical protein